MSNWLDDAEAQLEAEAAQQEAISEAKNWNSPAPKKGAIIKGKLVEVKHLVTKYGPTYLINLMDGDDQVWTIWCGSKLLEEQLLHQVPAVDKGVAVKYNGKKKGTDYEYHDYVLSCEPHESQEKRTEWAQFYRALALESGEVAAVSDHEATNAPTASQQAGLTDPF